MVPKPGVQGVEAPWRGAGCPRRSPFSLISGLPREGERCFPARNLPLKDYSPHPACPTELGYPHMASGIVKRVKVEGKSDYEIAGVSC
jgi:hypothetical protein